MGKFPSPTGHSLSSPHARFAVRSLGFPHCACDDAGWRGEGSGFAYIFAFRVSLEPGGIVVFPEPPWVPALVALRVHPVEQGGGQVVGGAVATVTSPPPPPSGPRGFLLSSFLLAQSDAVSTSLAGWRKFCTVKFLPFVQFSLSNVIDFPCPPRVG